MTGRLGDKETGDEMKRRRDDGETRGEGSMSTG